MDDLLSRRKLLITATIFGLTLLAAPTHSQASDDDDDSEDNSGSGNDSDDNDDNIDEDDDDDSDDDDGSSGSNSGSGSGDSSGRSNSKSRSQRELDDARRAIRTGKAVPLVRLIKHVRANFGGKVLDVNLNRSFFRYTYRVKHLSKDGRLQTLKFDALTLKKL